jgi:hypothetical protein
VLPIIVYSLTYLNVRTFDRDSEFSLRKKEVIRFVRLTDNFNFDNLNSKPSYRIIAAPFIIQKCRNRRHDIVKILCDVVFKPKTLKCRVVKGMQIKLACIK